MKSFQYKFLLFIPEYCGLENAIGFFINKKYRLFSLVKNKNG